MILSKIQIDEDDGFWSDISLRDFEELIENENMEKEAAELFARKRKYIKFVDGTYIRLVWKK